ncbi:MAG TPA: DUF3048 domain-containing protein [Coriobacteriia bacterium]|nr:DUF3048 domain-containing protein [Coriobacteriia bacterium]
MIIGRPVRFALLMVVSLGILTSGGCSKAEPEGILSYWPKAERERVVAKPPEPPRWPLTGLDAPDAEALRQRIISVKIENSPAARPKTNLQPADVVYESVAEGGVTRFNALYHSQIPEDAGPVRSARLSDLHIVPQYGALFVFSGASTSVNAEIRQAGLENLSEDAGVSYPYYRSSQRAAPHNLFVVFGKMREEAARRGMPTTRDNKGLVFDLGGSADTTPSVTSIDIPFSTANRVRWTYDARSGAYLRENNGKVHTDRATGKQISARNVVVLWARHEAATRDKFGSVTYRIILRGSGRCSVFRNGQRYDGTWEAAADAPPTFKAEDGTQIKLTPGNTWFQVVQTTVNITMK